MVRETCKGTMRAAERARKTVCGGLDGVRVTVERNGGSGAPIDAHPVSRDLA